MFGPRKSVGVPPKANPDNFLIKDIIEEYYPQITTKAYHCTKGTINRPSLTDDIIKLKKSPRKVEVMTSGNMLHYTIIDFGELVSPNHGPDLSVSEGQYETPWDIQTPWITKLMNMDSNNAEDQSKVMSEVVKASSLEVKNNSWNGLQNNLAGCSPETKMPKSYDKTDHKKSNSLTRLSSSSYTDDEEEDADMGSEDDKLKEELLAEIQPGLFLMTMSAVLNKMGSDPLWGHLRVRFSDLNL